MIETTMDDGGVHVIAGPSAAACLKEGMALPSDSVLIHHDLLSCGPLRPFESLEAWRDLREGYLRTLDPGNPPFKFEEQDRDLLTNSERLREASSVTLWLGTGLPEQLLLAWVVALLRRLDVDALKCRFIQFDHDRKHEVVGIGVLNPSRFREHPEPTRLETAVVQEILRAWDAASALQPDGLLKYVSDGAPTLPLLRRGLSSLLYHYPELTTGLNDWEYQLLRYSQQEGPKATSVVAFTMAHDMEFPEWMADTYLFQRLRRLGDVALRKPLLRLSGDGATLRGTDVHLTREGEEVLVGRGNAAEWNGVDDWVGGVHLNSAQGNVWFRSGHTLVRAGLT
jgi:hypothetical protein